MNGTREIVTLVKLGTCHFLLNTIPISYREEASEIYWEDTKENYVYEAFQYCIGGIKYRFHGFSFYLRKTLFYLEKTSFISSNSLKRTCIVILGLLMMVELLEIPDETISASLSSSFSENTIFPSFFSPLSGNSIFPSLPL